MIALVITILILTIIILTFNLLAYRRRINDICRQFQLFLEHDSNVIIKDDSKKKSIKRLVENINLLLKKYRQEKNIFQKKERAISDVYTNISHDIRTPLTSLDGYVQLLSESTDEKEKERYLNVVRERINCLKEMLEELFTFTKLKNDSYNLELSKCSFNKILTETLFSYYEEWKIKGIEPDIILTEETKYFNGNEAAMKRVLQNVLKNALEHGEKKLKITMRSDEKITLKIGNIIPEGVKIDKDKVFERFYKADEARSKTSTGLGLSIAKGFVEKMNGKIYAVEEKGWFIICIQFNCV